MAGTDVIVRYADPRTPDVADLGAARAALLPPELARLSSIRTVAERESFLIGRALLRAAVAEVTGVDAADVRISARCPRCGAEHGRPAVAGPGPAMAADVRLSLSRCSAAVVVAAAIGADVGVDVEVMDPGRFAGVEDVVMAASERSRLGRLPRARRPAAVARCWTRKEAVLKVSGEGLARDPRSFEIARERSAAPRIEGLGRPMRIQDLKLGDGLVASLAVAL